MTSEELLLDELKKNACYRMDENLRMVVTSLEYVEDNEVWSKPNAQLNSIGNLILHLCGNIGQYVLSGLGGKQDLRDREAEFAMGGGLSKLDLLQKLQATVSDAKSVILKTDLEDYLQLKKIQGFEMTGVGAVIHAVEHFSYHTGQIAFWVKWKRGVDLGFYGDHNLNTLNE